MKRNKTYKYKIFVEYDLRKIESVKQDYDEILGVINTKKQIKVGDCLWVKVILPAINTYTNYKKRIVYFKVKAIKENIIIGDVVKWQTK